MTIVEFLEARLAEDERRAGVDQVEFRTLAGRWTTVQGELRPADARVLREVAAKRAILTVWRETQPPYASPRQQEIHETLDDEVLRPLASVYADHPDYDPAWAPA